MEILNTDMMSPQHEWRFYFASNMGASAVGSARCTPCASKLMIKLTQSVESRRFKYLNDYSNIIQCSNVLSKFESNIILSLSNDIVKTK